MSEFSNQRFVDIGQQIYIQAISKAENLSSVSDEEVER